MASDIEIKPGLTSETYGVTELEITDRRPWSERVRPLDPLMAKLMDQIEELIRETAIRVLRESVHGTSGKLELPKLIAAKRGELLDMPTDEEIEQYGGAPFVWATPDEVEKYAKANTAKALVETDKAEAATSDIEQDATAAEKPSLIIPTAEEIAHIDGTAWFADLKEEQRGQFDKLGKTIEAIRKNCQAIMAAIATGVDTTPHFTDLTEKGAEMMQLLREANMDERAVKENVHSTVLDLFRAAMAEKMGEMEAREDRQRFTQLAKGEFNLRFSNDLGAGRAH